MAHLSAGDDDDDDVDDDDEDDDEEDEDEDDVAAAAAAMSDGAAMCWRDHTRIVSSNEPLTRRSPNGTRHEHKSV